MADERLPLRIYCHNDGSLRADCPPDAGDRCATLASFLQSDVQTSLRYIAELLEVLQAVEHGHRRRWEGTGNAFTLTITTHDVTIENAIFPDDHVQHYSPAEFCSALLEAAKVIGGKTGTV